MSDAVPQAPPRRRGSPQRHGRRRPTLRERWQRDLAANADFRRLWAGDAVSVLGLELVGLAVPVLAVRVLGADELQMGLLTACEMLAFLLIGLPAGAWVDRWRKRRVLMAGDAVRAALLLTLPVAYLFDVLTLWQLYAVTIGVGAATVFFDVANQSYLPHLVPPERLGEGNARLQALQSVSQVAGPAVGGVLVRAVGAPLAIGGTAACMLASVLLVRRIRHVETPPPRQERRPLRQEVGEGLSFVLRHPLLARITACTALGNLFAAVSGALLVLYVLRDLGLDEVTLGLVFSSGAVAGLVAALVTTRVSRWLGEGRTIPLAALAAAPFAALTPLATVLPAVPALVAGSAGTYFFVVVYNITQVSFRQRLCPPRLLGRMNASIRFLVWGQVPVGGLLGGLLGARFGVVPTLWVAAAGTAAASLPVLLSPLVRMRDLPGAG